jgi:hypothetical protein
MLHQQMGHTQAAIADLSQAAHQFRDLGLGTHYQQALKLMRYLQAPPLPGANTIPFLENAQTPTP